jgi:hypothetical protein
MAVASTLGCQPDRFRHLGAPSNRFFTGGTLAFGQTFAAMDQLLDKAPAGPFYFRTIYGLTVGLTGSHPSDHADATGRSGPQLGSWEVGQAESDR